MHTQHTNFLGRHQRHMDASFVQNRVIHTAACQVDAKQATVSRLRLCLQHLWPGECADSFGWYLTQAMHTARSPKVGLLRCTRLDHQSKALENAHLWFCNVRLLKFTLSNIADHWKAWTSECFAWRQQLGIIYTRSILVTVIVSKLFLLLWLAKCWVARC